MVADADNVGISSLSLKLAEPCVNFLYPRTRDYSDTLKAKEPIGAHQPAHSPQRKEQSPVHLQVDTTQTFANALTCWVPVTLRRRFYDRSLDCGFIPTIDNDASIVTIKVTMHLLIVNKYSNMVKW